MDGAAQTEYEIPAAIDQIEQFGKKLHAALLDRARRAADEMIAAVHPEASLRPDLADECKDYAAVAILTAAREAIMDLVGAERWRQMVMDASLPWRLSAAAKRVLAAVIESGAEGYVIDNEPKASCAQLINTGLIELRSDIAAQIKECVASGRSLKEIYPEYEGKLHWFPTALGRAIWEAIRSSSG